MSIAFTSIAEEAIAGLLLVAAPVEAPIVWSDATSKDVVQTWPDEAEQLVFNPRQIAP